MFNLELPAPSWASSWAAPSDDAWGVDDYGRRLMIDDDDGVTFGGTGSSSSRSSNFTLGSGWFDASEDDAMALFGNLYYVLTVVTGICAAHLGLFNLLSLASPNIATKIPKGLKVPHFEIKTLLCVSLGMLNVASTVLLNSKVAPGWKLVASIEILGAVAFMFWFHVQGRAFSRDTLWIPSLKDRELQVFREFHSSGDDDDEEHPLTLEEFVVKPYLVGLPNVDEARFAFQELDLNNDGLIDSQEFRAGLISGRLQIEKPTRMRWFYEFAFGASSHYGVYVPKVPGTDIKEPWGR